MVGIDLLEIERFAKVFEKYQKRFLERIFTERELAYFYRMGPTEIIISELAARFAAKEAVSKALGTGIKLLGSKGKKGVSWKEIEILTESTGKPKVCLRGKAKEVAEDLGFKEIHVSLTHTKNLAQAIAWAEKV